jgi:hypothetical protein
MYKLTYNNKEKRKMNSTQSKSCVKCGLNKPFKEYSKRKRATDGLKSQCKACDHLDYIRTMDIQKASAARGYKKNKSRLNALATIRHRERYKTDPQYAIKNRLRGALRHALNNNYNSFVFKHIGLSLEETKTHLFLTAMRNGYMDFDPDNMKAKYEIDHIIPLKKFDLTTERGIDAAYNWTNLQILEKVDNIQKESISGIQQR